MFISQVVEEEEGVDESQTDSVIFDCSRWRVHCRAGGGHNFTKGAEYFLRKKLSGYLILVML